MLGIALPNGWQKRNQSEIPWRCGLVTELLDYGWAESDGFWKNGISTSSQLKVYPVHFGAGQRYRIIVAFRHGTPGGGGGGGGAGGSSTKRPGIVGIHNSGPTFPTILCPSLGIRDSTC